jgi:hypothetical protein
LAGSSKPKRDAALFSHRRGSLLRRQAGTAEADQAGSANCLLEVDVLIVGTAGSMRTMVFLPM